MAGLAYVVVLNWNGLSYLRDCLRAVFAQTYEPMRVVVVDNASTDGSATIAAAEFPEAISLALPENLHFARGTNAGIRRALLDPACEYVATLNNDTRADPDWLGGMVRSMEEGVGSVASKMMFMDRMNVLNSAGLWILPDGGAMDRGWGERDEGQYDARTDVFGASAGAALYRRTMLDQLGLLDEDFVAYYEDVDLAWRARLAGWACRYAPDSVVKHKWSGSVGPRSAWRIYQCERNRIWNVVQNYPWRYVAAGAAWNAAHTLAAHPAGMEARALVRARVDAYAGLRKALTKRGRHRSQSRVETRTVGRWLRTYGRGGFP